ncbi:mannose-specific lectin 3-like [Canna indica]|uniref:Mannose-specific lectin 3-like n=1 Tax=Canna indica TaxID=4628 RepID=A0AAQ3KZT6_9LILI|nr:mannose-specific lectin 3-like [Canna indica]
MAIPSLVEHNAPLLLALSILVFLAATSSANEENVLLTGDVLGTDSQLSYAGATFVMQGDCNLVLYNKGSGFQSNTHGAGHNCTLSLTDRGNLVITSSLSTVWRSPVPGSEGKRGKYAAVLRPDGQLAVYGPAVWSTPGFGLSAAGHEAAELAAIPMVRNVLFSSQVLYANAELATRDYAFVMRDDCDLALSKAGNVVWQSGTAGRGRHCFVRLDHRGQLAVVGDHNYKALWTSKSASSDGDYVLILQINGQAVVYGPVVWSTN